MASATPLNPAAHYALKEVGSTNDEAFRLAKASEEDLFFVTAERQLQGRGRQGRVWVSEAGNLYVSLFLRNPGRPEHFPTLSFVAAVALQEAISACAGEPQGTNCRLKWPNDVLWNGSKIAGILLEMRKIGDQSHVVVGMGVNCAHFPGNTSYPASSLSAEGIHLTPDALFPVLQKAVTENITLWQRGEGFPEIREKWLSRAHTRGERLVVKYKDGDVSGFFQGLDEIGRLIFRQTGKDDQFISAGDVFFPESRS